MTAKNELNTQYVFNNIDKYFVDSDGNLIHQHNPNFNFNKEELNDNDYEEIIENLFDIENIESWSNFSFNERLNAKMAAKVLREKDDWKLEIETPCNEYCFGIKGFLRNLKNRKEIRIDKWHDVPLLSLIREMKWEDGSYISKQYLSDLYKIIESPISSKWKLFLSIINQIKDQIKDQVLKNAMFFGKNYFFFSSSFNLNTCQCDHPIMFGEKFVPDIMEQAKFHIKNCLKTSYQMEEFKDKFLESFEEWREKTNHSENNNENNSSNTLFNNNLENAVSEKTSIREQINNLLHGNNLKTCDLPVEWQEWSDQLKQLENNQQIKNFRSKLEEVISKVISIKQANHNLQAAQTTNNAEQLAQVIQESERVNNDSPNPELTTNLEQAQERLFTINPTLAQQTVISTISEQIENSEINPNDLSTDAQQKWQQLKNGELFSKEEIKDTAKQIKQEVQEKSNNQKLTNWEQEIEHNLTNKDESQINELKNQLTNFINHCPNSQQQIKATSLLVKLENYLSNGQLQNDKRSTPITKMLVGGAIILLLMIIIIKITKKKKVKNVS